jgi:hypothetical protein
VNTKNHPPGSPDDRIGHLIDRVLALDEDGRKRALIYMTAYDPDAMERLLARIERKTEGTP